MIIYVYMLAATVTAASRENKLESKTFIEKILILRSREKESKKKIG